MRLLKVTIYIAAFFIVHACESRVYQSHVLAQNDRPAFEVASIKVHKGDPGDARGISFSPSGRFAWNWMTLRQLIPSAFAELEFKQVVGGPGWLDAERFDI